MGTRQEELDLIEEREEIKDLTEAIKLLVFAPKTIVSCPAVPYEILGITAADALDVGDAMGSISKIAVPKSGVIYSATLWDLDDEGLQIDLEVFKNNFTQIANDAAWALADADSFSFITELNFFIFDDHGTCQTSEITNKGKAYNAPEGFFYIQAVARGASNIAAGAMPRFQLQIESFDPTFEV